MCTLFVGILEEAKFFGIESLVPQLESLIQSSQRSRDNVPLTRRDVVNALILTPYTAELRFQGVNLAGSDLSRLDLRYINFKVGKIYIQTHPLPQFYALILFDLTFKQVTKFLHSLTLRLHQLYSLIISEALRLTKEVCETKCICYSAQLLSLFR